MKKSLINLDKDQISQFDERVDQVIKFCHLEDLNKDYDLIYFLCLDRTKITQIKFHQITEEVE